MAYTRPFLKWAGNKFKILPTIISLLPNSTRLIEPFLGSGSLLVNRPTKYYLGGDINGDLINVFETLRTYGEGFIKELEPLFSQEAFNKVGVKTRPGEEAFYLARNEFNTTNDLKRKAALFVFLNQHCFNGLCRYNKYGLFSTPYNLGFTTKKGYAEIQRDRFIHALKMLDNAELRHTSFENTMVMANKGDVVYCDPPYLPLDHKSNTFTDYTVDGFKLEQQQLIADLASDLRNYGITTVISNHSCTLSRKIYHNADDFIFLDVKRSMGRYEGYENSASELMAVYRAK